MQQNRYTVTNALARTLAITAITALAGCQPNVSERDLDPAETSDIVEAIQAAGTILVDARTPSAYRLGHIPRAINLNIADIDLESRRRADLLAADRIIVYGQNPGDPLAAGLALRLLEAGYKSTTIYRGGTDAWSESGGELTTTEQ